MTKNESNTSLTVAKEKLKQAPASVEAVASQAAAASTATASTASTELNIPEVTEEWKTALVYKMRTLSPDELVELSNRLKLPYPFSLETLQRHSEADDLDEKFKWLCVLDKHPEHKKMEEEKFKEWWKLYERAVIRARLIILENMPPSVQRYKKEQLYALYIERGVSPKDAEALANRIHGKKVLHMLLKKPEEVTRDDITVFQAYNMYGLYPLEIVALMGHLKSMRTHPNGAKQEWYHMALLEKGKLHLNARQSLETPEVYANASALHFQHYAYESTEVVKATPLPTKPSPSEASSSDTPLGRKTPDRTTALSDSITRRNNRPKKRTTSKTGTGTRAHTSASMSSPFEDANIFKQARAGLKSCKST